MPRGSVGRRVARAASTGGGRAAARRNTPWSWWVSMGLIVVLGVALVGISRQEHLHPAAASKSSDHPTLFDHWHEALAFDICGTIEPNPPENPNTSSAGIHTHGDGLIHIEPLSAADTGKNATLGRFVKLYPGMALTATSVQYPGQPAKHDGDLCEGKPASVQVKVWNSPSDNTGHLLTGNPTDLRLQNGQEITIAFVPAGAKIPKPPAKVITNLLQAMTEASSSTSTTARPMSSTTTSASSSSASSSSSTSSSSASTASSGGTGTTSTSKP